MKVLLAKGTSENRRFRKPETALNWIEAELDFWAWLDNARPNEVSNFIETYRRVLKNAKIRIDEAIRNDPTAAEEETVHSLQSISNAVEEGTYVVSSSPIAKFIELRKETGLIIAAYILVLECSSPNYAKLSFNRSSVKAFIDHSNFHDGLHAKSVESTSNSLASLSAKLDASIGLAENAVSEFQSQIRRNETRSKRSSTTLARFIRRKRSSFSGETKDLRQKFDEKLEEVSSATAKEIDQFKEFYEDKIALLEPVAYWDKKRKNHRNSAIGLALAFICYSATLVNIAQSGVSKLELQGLELLSVWKQVGLEGIAALTFVVALGLIGSRILYRLFSSQLHLWNDAAERVTMIKTYLAFAKRDHAKEEHMQFLIQRLFAPASDGVVKDEFGSLGPADWISSKASR